MRAMIYSGLVLLALCGNAAAFDCDNPTNAAVAVVCSDPELRQLTKERAQVWKATHDRIKGEARKSLVADERRWMKEYPRSCGVTGTKPPTPIDKKAQECFKQANRDRIAYLRAYGTAGAPAAATPTLPAAAPVKAPAAPPIETAPTVTRAVATPEARYHLKFTFACQTPDKLSRVLGALERNDIGYALSQTDCLPVPEGREASLLSVAGTVAKVRLCSTDAGCTDVYAAANMVLDPNGKPVGK